MYTLLTKTLKISKVAPTVVVDYNKHKYLEQQEMLGKIVGKEDKVKAWKKDWEETTAKDGKEIKSNWTRCNSVIV